MVNKFEGVDISSSTSMMRIVRMTRIRENEIIEQCAAVVDTFCNSKIVAEAVRALKKDPDDPTI